MKRRRMLSVKMRITLWYAVLLVAICISAVMTLVGLSERAVEAYSRDTLRSAAVVLMDEMEIEHGMLEIDSDLEEVPNVYASLFEEDGSLIYGRRRVNLSFEDGAVRQTQWSGHRWYVHDVRLDIPNRSGVWLRLYLSADVSAGVYDALAHYGVWLLPLLGFVALGGGYLITARAFRPVKEMTDLASSIAGGGDLSRRVATQEGRTGDELHTLAATLNAMLERLQRAFDHERQFTSDAAHELRTPLNAMRIQGEYALTKESGEEKDEAIVRMLEKNEEMHALVSQLLMIARMDAGQTPLEDSCDLAQMIAQAAEDMQPVADERGVRIETDAAPDAGCVVRGSRAMLMRAIVNLTDNAIRYGKENGCIRMALQTGEDDVRVIISDDGEGIAAKDLPHVFERFWRADSARTSQGTGIGLAIVRAAARMHGGEAYAQSEAGKGSSFIIYLPKKQDEKN
ncbi:MAG: HAMP domain-containing protein [Clostridia bacterium]|nr:HAMP domain-containing protein [Clostridia bacterium]